MKKRYLVDSIHELAFSDHKMAFVSGPRQCGKTTMAKQMLSLNNSGSYFNWDQHEFRRVWATNPSTIAPSRSSDKAPILVLDEIHKAKLWKRTLKGIFDTLDTPTNILVTGSARLNVYKKGSDSLLGRYFNFRLHPFSLRELAGLKPLSPDNVLLSLFSKSLSVKKKSQDYYKDMKKFGSFPEPLFAQNEKKARLWRSSRSEKVIREDLRDITRIPELSRIEMLTAMLPDKIGSPFSVASINQDLDVSFQTASRWINYLKELYYIFEIKPYHSSIARSLKKEGKIYFWDFMEAGSDSSRFENMVACHLLKACHYWTDTGEGKFDLYYLRDKEKREIDFLITKDSTPWLPIEVKLHDTTPSPNWEKFLNQIPCKRGLQIVDMNNHWRSYKLRNGEVLVAGACEALMYFI